jgi:hypothetical protein
VLLLVLLLVLLALLAPPCSGSGAFVRHAKPPVRGGEKTQSRSAAPYFALVDLWALP